MINSITYRVYTICELRNWLVTNTRNGLSEFCIAPVRAYALINSPCTQEDDPAIVVAFDAERSIGYSAVFADEYVNGNTTGKYFWGTTEWLEPEYRGKGIAGDMMRKMKIAVGEDKYVGLDSSIASIKLDQKQGSHIALYDRVRFQLSSNGSIKGRCLQRYVSLFNKRILRELNRYGFQNQYINYIDEMTYQFIKKHAENDLFLRQREMFNWMLHYPFLIGTHNDPKTKKEKCEFSSLKKEYSIEAIKVYIGDELAGVYIVSQTNNERTLRYLYFDNTYRNEVFASVTLNLLKPDIEKVYYMSADLLKFMQTHGIMHLNRKTYIEKVALTLPQGMTINTKLHIQGGDGDMFC